MCPAEVKNMIFGIVKTETTADEPTYLMIRDQIISWCSNTVSSSAAHMDIGNLGYEPWGDTYYPCQPCEAEYAQEHEVDFQVNMLGNCYTCGAQGHPSRLCPTQGKGKGQPAMRGTS